MGAHNSSIQENLRYTAENADRDDANVRRLKYHGVQYPKGKLSPPEGTPSVKDITQNSLTVTWSPPQGCPISCILAYHLEVCRTCDKRWKTVTKSCQGTRYDVKNLSPDTDYAFRVRAENVFGVSKPSQTTIPIRTRQAERWASNRSDDSEKSAKLVRRHSHYIKVETSVSRLLNKTEECETTSRVGTIPFKRNSSIRMSLPLQRRPVTSFLPGSRRESVCSKDSRPRSIEESSVFTDDTDEMSSLKLHRISTSTEDDSCNRSSSAASMTSIPEDSDLCDQHSNKNEKNALPWKTSDLPESSDILSAPYSDDTKLAWVSRTPPSQKHLEHASLEDDLQVWKVRNDCNHSNKSSQDLRSLRSVLNSNDLLVKTLNSDNNGNYAYLSKERLYSDTIKEVDEENVAMDIVSTL